ncbi:hypothetical protein Asal01_01401 [Fodinibius salicampi]
MCLIIIASFLVSRFEAVISNRFFGYLEPINEKSIKFGTKKMVAGYIEVQ